MSTLNDVAREAGVSVITVSRVINNPEKVKEKTRKRVEDVMARLNYTPNPVAKALVTKKVGIIDVYIPESIDLSNPFVVYFIAGISEVLSRHMYSFLILRDRKHEHKRDGYIATGLLKNEVDEMYQYARERNRPLALFGHTDIPDVDCIDVNNMKGVRDITSYLLEKGHRKIGMINVDEEKDYTAERKEGFLQALEEKGVTGGETRILSVRNDVQGGYAGAKELLAEEPELTAIFCATDTMAIGAVQAVTECGYRIPEDISVAGFDGLGHHLMSSPKITTMRQPVFEIGQLLAETLLDRLAGREEKVSEYLETELLTEQSVGETAEKQGV